MIRAARIVALAATAVGMGAVITTVMFVGWLAHQSRPVRDG